MTGETDEQANQEDFLEELAPEHRRGNHAYSQTNIKNENSVHKHHKVGLEGISLHNPRNSQIFNEAASVSREEVILKENEIIYLQDEVDYLRQKVQILDEKNTELQKVLTDKNSNLKSGLQTR